MTAEMCWDNENRTPMPGYYLDPNLDLPVSGDVAHAFEPHPATGELWTREAEPTALVESSAKNLHVSWPSIPAGLCGVDGCVYTRGHSAPLSGVVVHSWER
jgi:hypothetical protein